MVRGKIKSIVFLIVLLQFIAQNFFAQSVGQKNGVIKVRKQTTPNKNWVDSVGMPEKKVEDTLLKGASLLIDYKYFFLDTVTSIESSNLPASDKCVSCWYKDNIIYKNRKVGVKFPTILLGGYLLKQIEDSLRVVNPETLEKNFTIDTFEIGFLIDNKGKLYDFIYPISRTNHNSFLVHVLSKELNEINVNTSMANKTIFMKGGHVFLEPEKKKQRSLFKKKQTREKLETNVYCHVFITIKNSQFNKLRQDYLVIDKPLNCDAFREDDSRFKNEVINSQNMIFPILKTHFR